MFRITQRCKETMTKTSARALPGRHMGRRSLSAPFFSMFLTWFVVVVASMSTLSVVHGQTTIVPLTDTTFEHQTQASTGATTGSWLVLFHSSNEDECNANHGDMSCSDIHTSVEQLMIHDEMRDALYERGIVLGDINVSDNKRTMIRFDIEAIPTVIYIHHGKYYTFPFTALPATVSTEEGEEVAVEKNAALTQQLYSFILNEYSKVDGKSIPSPPSFLEDLEESLIHILEDKRALGAIIAVIILFGVGVISMASRANSKDFHSKKRN